MVEDALKVPVEEKETLPTPQPIQAPMSKPHKKAKGPNPLSVKKKQPKPQPSQSTNRKTKQDSSTPNPDARKRGREHDDPKEGESSRPKKKRRRRNVHEEFGGENSSVSPERMASPGRFISPL
jgi:hypothetical protein